MVDEFLKGSSVYIRQVKEWGEILVGWESKNKYEVFDDHKQQVGFIVESGSGFLNAISRLFLRSHRPLEVAVLGMDQKPILHLRRPFFWFFSDLTVLDSQSRTLGHVHRRFAVLEKRYDLAEASGHPFAQIKSGLFKIWTFPILQSGREAGVITKEWGGALREFFTDADCYQIDYSRANWSTEQRAVILAAAISIDFDFFEDNTSATGAISMSD